jgi:hypothetical protein
LSLRVPDGLPVRRYHVDLEEEVRRERLIQDCILRGCDEAQALAVYRQRLLDECPVIESFVGDAERLSVPGGVA